MRSIIILLSLIGIIINAQDRKDWTLMDYLNNELEEIPYENEKDINGLFFITLSDSLNYYETPILVEDINGKLFVKINVNESDVLTEYNGATYNRYDSKNPLNPWLISLNPDYFRLAFECIEETEDCYTIKLNESDLGYIKKNNLNFRKQTNEEFVKSWLSLGLDFNRASNPLYININSENEIPNPNKKNYNIWRADFIEMKGDWMKIKTIENEIGWIRWKNKNKILIRLYYTC